MKYTLEKDLNIWDKDGLTIAEKGKVIMQEATGRLAVVAPSYVTQKENQIKADIIARDIKIAQDIAIKEELARLEELSKIDEEPIIEPIIEPITK